VDDEIVTLMGDLAPEVLSAIDDDERGDDEALLAEDRSALAAVEQLQAVA
jgi:hypothetical protein